MEYRYRETSAKTSAGRLVAFAAAWLAAWLAADTCSVMSGAESAAVVLCF